MGLDRMSSGRNRPGEGVLPDKFNFMSSLFQVGRRCLRWALLPLLAVGVQGQWTFAPQGAQYELTPRLPGDQVFPKIALNGNGGYLVWQDNATDGDGLGVRAMMLNNYFSPVLQRVFRVNEEGAADQMKPAVALLPNHGAVVVWQGGLLGQQDIYARFVSSDGTFKTGDVRVNTYTAGQQADAVVSVLADGNVVVVWSSHDQDGSLQGVYAQRFTADGTTLGGEFRVNQFVTYNQRSPAVAALDTGNFAVAWVSEQQRFENSIDIFARLYDGAGNALGNEWVINTGTNLCANPVLSPESGGGFLVGWSERDLADLSNGWDVRVRRFDPAGQPLASPMTVNQRLRGDQYAPQVASIGTAHLVSWTSMGQDTNREGVYGRFIQGGELGGEEFRVNTTVISSQMHQAVASDGERSFVVAWTSFIGSPSNFDLFGQRYSMGEIMPPPAPPFIAALDEYGLAVSWPAAVGYDVAAYLLYVDGSGTPLRVTEAYHVLADLNPASTHTVALAYELGDGRVSPASEPAVGRTWGRDENRDGLPDDWQKLYWGENRADWPARDVDWDGDGASNLDEFMAGTDPTDPSSVLRVELTATAQGPRLTWNTQPGLVYQPQVSADIGLWHNLGEARFAPGAVDSVALTGPSSAAYYRVLRLR